MGRQPAKKPVIIDLVDSSDSEIEIIHHKIPVQDDEPPPLTKPGPSRPRTYQQGSTLQSPLPAVKVERTPVRIVRTETPPHPTDPRNHGRKGLGSSCGQVITGGDETYSDVASEVDDEYSHEKALEEMPWLSESDIKDVPPTRSHLYHMAIHHKAIQDIQHLSINEKQTTPQKLVSKPLPWFSVPDSLLLKIQSMPITGAQHNNISHVGTPNWRRPYHLRTSKGFDDWRELQLIDSQRAAPGSVNQIAQSGGVIAIASSTVQGGDDSFPTVDNIGPSLLFWKENSGFYPMYSHTKFYGIGTIPQEEIRGGEYIEGLKHFAVSDVKFHPQSPWDAVSCGYDKRVFFWSLDPDGDQLYPWISGRIEMDKVPSELHYRGDEHGTLAIVADGSIHLCKHTQGTPAILDSDQNFEPAKNCCVSGLQWGRNRTSDLLFVTWQPHGHRKVVNKHNYHQSLSIRDGKLVYNFSASNHPGSALDLSPDGSRIALVTHTNASHKVSIFDVRVAASEPSAEFTISGVRHGKDVEHLKFDPSGEYLAIGRSDNVAQIFDTRMGAILHTLHHGGSISMKPPGEQYGITGMEWVVGWHGYGIRLLTGGEDGCVRMWDITRPAIDYRTETPLLDGHSNPANGHAIAREKDPIGHFSVGNKGIYDGHQVELVVGDESGYISIYDRKGVVHR